MILPKAIRDAYAATLERQASHVALTLVYNDIGVSLARIRRDLRGLRNQIDRKLLGSRYYKRQPHERSQVWAVVQLIDDYPHIHCGWQMPPTFGIDDFRKSMDADKDGSYKHSGLWLRFAPRGDYDALGYYLGWAGYSLRDLTDSANIFTSAEFLR